MNIQVIAIVLIVNSIVAIALIIQVWLKACGVLKKMIWSIILIVPVFGPIFYTAFFNPPKPFPSYKRQGVHEYVAPGAKEIIDRDHGVTK